MDEGVAGRESADALLRAGRVAERALEAEVAGDIPMAA